MPGAIALVGDSISSRHNLKILTKDTNFMQRVLGRFSFDFTDKLLLVDNQVMSAATIISGKRVELTGHAYVDGGIRYKGCIIGNDGKRRSIEPTLVHDAGEGDARSGVAAVMLDRVVPQKEICSLLEAEAGGYKYLLPEMIGELSRHILPKMLLVENSNGVFALETALYQEKLILHIAVDSEMRVVGSIEISGSTTLHEARAVIDMELERESVPSSFRMKFQSAPVSLPQEVRRLAIHCMPTLVLLSDWRSKERALEKEFKRRQRRVQYLFDVLEMKDGDLYSSDEDEFGNRSRRRSGYGSGPDRARTAGGCTSISLSII